MKKLLTILLAGVLLFSAIPLSVNAESDDYYEGFLYEAEGNDSYYTADTVFSGCIMMGMITWDDEDYFEFYVEDASDLELIAFDSYGMLYITLYDEYLDPICEGTCVGYEEGAYYYLLECTVTSGFYYLCVSSDFDNYYDDDYAFILGYESVSHSHSYIETVVDPTCWSYGYTLCMCSCGDYYYINETESRHTYTDPWDIVCDMCGHERTITNGWTKVNNRWVYYQNGNAVTNRWIKDNVGWCYLEADGYMATNCWKKDSNGWCYLGNGGHMVVNTWVKDSKGWCYVGADGYMVTNKWVKDAKGWCYVGADGYMVTNKWMKDSGGWCYLGANGYMAVNQWAKDGNGWLYLNDGGRIVKNAWVQDNVSWCYVGSNGYLVTNKWMKHNNKWCYLDNGGHMAKSTWVKDNVGWCYLTADGYMAVNQWAKDSVGWVYLNDGGRIVKNQWVKTDGIWYYLGSNGYMVTNKWVKDGNHWYYLQGDGTMATNQWILDTAGMCYVDKNGQMVVNRWVLDEGGWSFVDQGGHMLANQWKKDSNGWCYLGEDGYMVTETWAKDSSGWCYLDENGYMAWHPNGNCDHYFSDATYYSAARCHYCGTTSGQPLYFPLSLEGDEPFYVLLADDFYETEVAIYNLQYTTYDGYIKLQFDMEKTYDSDGNDAQNYIGARFKLYDEDGYVIDSVSFFEDEYSVGEKIRSKHVYLHLDGWDRSSELTLVVEEYKK